MSSGSKSVKVGYRYYFGLHFLVSRGEVDELLEAKVGGKRAWRGSVTGNASIQIDAPELFGGDDGEGGIQGRLDVMMGGPTQAVNSELESMLGGLVPAFRGMFTLFYDGLVTSMNPYPKAWTFRFRRALKGWDGAVWYPEKAVVVLTDPETGDTIKAMNPAHILYELETNRDWGRGKERSRLDDAAWRAAADQLYAEGFGLCLRWVRSDSIDSFAGSVLDHIAGNLFTSRTTGLRKLTLVRSDYAVEDLPHFAPDSGLLDIQEDDNSAGADAVNEIIVTWRNPVDNSKRPARERNLAAVRAAGGRVISAQQEYLGLPTYNLAARVAKRDLRAKVAAKRWKLILDRRARDIEPGAAFRFSYPSRGLHNIVVRAGRVDEGPLGDGRITITAVLDVFGLPATTFSATPPSGWQPPVTTPQVATVRQLTEATWRDLVRSIDPANLELIDASAGYLAALALRPTGLSLGFQLQTRVGVSAWLTSAGGDFCPSAALASALPLGHGPSSVTLSAGIDLDQVFVGMTALVGGELLRVDAFDLGTMAITFARGCVDSVPALHPIGSRVWFLDDMGGADPAAYTSGTTVQARLLTHTSSGVLDPALAPTDSLVIQARQNRPYPPGLFKINGLTYPASASGVVTLTWAHRDRLLQADQLVDTAQASIGPEPGVTYSARLLRADTEAEIQAVSGVSVATAVLSAPYDGQVIIELWAVRAGLASLYRHRHTLAYTGDFTISLLHFDGSDGSGDFIDSRGKVWTAYNGAVLTTAVKKFGTASGRFANAGHIATAAHMDFNFGSGDFTIGFWIRMRTLTRSFGTVVANGRTSWSSGCRYLMVPSALGGKVTVGGFDAVGGSGSYEASGNPLITSSAALPLNDWRHVELCRQGNTLYLFIEGVLQGTATTTALWDFSQLGTVVGRNLWDGVNGLLDADVDELYWRKGEAMHTSNFTPPAVPFS